MVSLLRTLSGFVLAPLAVPLSLMLMRALKAYKLGFGYDSDGFKHDMVSYGIIAYLIFGLLIAPVVIVFRRLKWERAFSFTILGSVAWFILEWLAPPYYSSMLDADRLMMAFSCSIAGALSGLVFWMISYWRPRVASC